MSVHLALHASSRATNTILMSTTATAIGSFHSILIAPHHSIDSLFVCSVLSHSAAFRGILIVLDIVGVLTADATATTVDFSAALGDRY